MGSKYNSKAADRFWTKRLGSTDALSAVLTYGAPGELNRAYDTWERRNLFSLLKPPLTGKRTLDIGYGTGRIALAMAKEGAEVTAIDISQGMLDHLCRRARRAGLVSRINRIHAASDAIPCSDRTFDIITCFGLLEHLPETVRRKTMQEAFRCLRQTGRLYIVVNNVRNIFLKGKYRLGRQCRDGYYVSLVGLEWLEDICDKYKMTTRVVGSNPLYALAHYYLNPRRKELSISQQEFKQFCKVAVKCDLSGEFEKLIPGRLSSHYMVQIRQSRLG